MHLIHQPIIILQEKNTIKILVSGFLRMKGMGFGSKSQILLCGSMGFVSAASL